MQSGFRGAGAMLQQILTALIDRTFTARCERRHLRRRRPRNAEPQLERRLMLSGTYSLLKDLWNGPSTDGSDITDMAQVGSTTYFIADTLDSGRELWKSDGTTSGTVMVKDIRPGVKNGAYAYSGGYLTNVSGTLFFIGDDGMNGPELWKSDGTSAGTVMVRDIYPGESGSGVQYLTNVNGTLFFSATDGSAGYELWKSDGTTGGTTQVKDISVSGTSSFPYELTEVNGTLFFNADNGLDGSELWKSDGTDSGTVLVKDIRSGAIGSYVRDLTNVGGTLFFGAFDGTTYALWRSDGTDSGTTLVAPGNASANNFTAVGNDLFFTFDDGASGTELYKSDGTLSGTVRVKDIVSGAGASSPSYLANVAGTLYFAASDGGTSGNELWKSDGTESGTVQVSNINTGNGFGSYPSYLTDVSGTVFFMADGGSNGYELWKSDGTDAGTTLVQDIRSGSNSSFPYLLTNANGSLFFVANNGTLGEELWKSDGTTAGTALVKDVQSGTADGDVDELVDLNGTLLLTANTAPNTLTLFASDGTAAGTTALKDFTNGDLEDMTAVGGNAFFIASDTTTGRELWKTDGTAAGTTLVRDIRSGTSSSYPRHLTNIDGTLFFSAIEDSSGRELWKSDGTSGGTTLVKDIRPGTANGSAYELTNINGTLFFAANDNTTGRELWKSDGTETGTVLIRDILSGTAGSYPDNLINLSGTLMFSAIDNSHGRELWTSDGTSAGTTLVKDINSGTDGSFPQLMTNVAGTLFFGAFDGTDYELWTSDGTVAGTTFVVTGNYSADNFTAVGSTLFFSFNDGPNGSELWKSDGTAAGTVLVRDIHTGIGGSDPQNFRSDNGKLYFNANDHLNGERLWESDGTASGTMMFAPGAGQPLAVDPLGVVRSGSNLFFSAISPAHGRELFQVDPQATNPPTTAPTITGPASLTDQQRPLISWTTVAEASEYEVWIKNQSTGTNPFYQANVTDTTHTPGTDLGIGRFNLWVRGKNSLGNGPWTPQYNFRIDTRATVNDPGRFLPTHRPTLSWPALPGAVKYDLWIDDKLGGVSQFIRDQNVTGTTWIPSSDMPLGLYHAWIRGIAADGTPGGWSRTTIFYVMPPPNMTQGTNPTFDRTPTFAWDPLLGAVKYEVFIRNRNTGATTYYQQNITDLNWTPPADLADGPYRVWVIGVSSVNVRSFWTNAIDIYVGGRTDVLTPANGSTSGTTPTFTWRPVDDDAGGTVTYNIWVDRVGVQSGYINQTGLTTTSYTHGSPLPAGTYRGWIQAVSSSNETIWSLVSEFSVASFSIDSLPDPDNDVQLVARPLARLETPTIASDKRDRRLVTPRETKTVPFDPAPERTTPAAESPPPAPTTAPPAPISPDTWRHIGLSEILDRI